MDGRLTRRTLLGSAGLGAGALVLGGVPVFADARRTRRRGVPFAKTGAFAEGVASGEPATGGITLWTRLGGGYNTDRKLMLEVSPDADFRRVLYRRNVVARAEKGHAITVRVETPRLRPGERYHYRFATREVESPVGRFATTRPADSREPVRIAFFSCQKYTSGYYGALATIAERDDLDLVVCLGDYIYETGGSGSDPRKDTTGENGDGVVRTLAEYRDKYRFYRTDADLRAMHAAHPFAAIWDDHEVENNYAGETPGTARPDPRATFPERKVNGYRAFFENMPMRYIAGEDFRLYRSMRVGRGVELFMLDTRQYRADQPCGDQLFAPCPEAESEPRQFLGREQMAWLKDGLAASDATWKVLANQVVAMALDTAAGQPINKDQWDGYGVERRELLGHVQQRGIQDVTFITGDIHTFFAGDVGVDGRGPESVATEFVGGSISSTGIPETIAGTTGVPLTREQYNELTTQVKLTNPHLKYDEQLSRGYGVLEARDEELLVEFKAIEARERRSTDARTIGSFRVARGEPRVQVL